MEIKKQDKALRNETQPVDLYRSALQSLKIEKSSDEALEALKESNFANPIVKEDGKVATFEETLAKLIDVEIKLQEKADVLHPQRKDTHLDQVQTHNIAGFFDSKIKPHDWGISN